MIEVVEILYEKTCWYCQARFRFTRGDVVKTRSDKYELNCPCCGMINVIEHLSYYEIKENEDE